MTMSATAKSRRLVPRVRVTVNLVASFPEWTLRKWHHIRYTQTDRHTRSTLKYWYIHNNLHTLEVRGCRFCGIARALKDRNVSISKRLRPSESVFGMKHAPPMAKWIAWAYVVGADTIYFHTNLLHDKLPFASHLPNCCQWEQCQPRPSLAMNVMMNDVHQHMSLMKCIPTKPHMQNSSTWTPLLWIASYTGVCVCVCPIVWFTYIIILEGVCS